VRHVENLIDMAAEGSFTYGGRGAAGDALFPSGECAILQGSSGLRGRVVREATFDWEIRPLPVYEDAIDAPLNSIIGGASFWVMTAPEPHRGRVPRRGRVLQLPRPARDRRALPRRDRLPADRLRRVREAGGRGLLRRRTPAPTSATSS
jgi:hypothetical protein